MAELTRLVCDNCGVVEETPVYGWVSLKPAKKSEIESQPPAKGDFCGVECLNTYTSKMAIQKQMDGLVSEASAALTQPLEEGDSESEDKPF